MSCKNYFPNLSQTIAQYWWKERGGGSVFKFENMLLKDSKFVDNV